MKEIGQQLKDIRIAKKYTYADIEKMTKMRPDQIEAIENGDFDFFENDISYLRFYVRKYAEVLGVNFDDIRDAYDTSVEEYTQTLSMKAMQEREELDQNIKQRREVPKARTYTEPPIGTTKDAKSIRQNVKQSARFRKNKVDVSLISLLVIVVVIVGVIIFAMFNNMFAPEDTNANNDKQSEVTPTPTPETDSDKEDDKEKEEEAKSDMVVSQVNASTYDITGLKLNDPLTLELKIETGIETWFRAYLNGQEVITGDVYNSTSKVAYTGTVGANDVYTLNFGNYGAEKVSIFINGTKVTIDPNVASATNVIDLTLNVKGQ
ncbi:hypothetical protein A4S06_04625 [Erysipelotrichaceae bacterium MTC7]|nr:hypothetical protein A4S06_04625 [Erysipelotrichaceae bacterium MTC7]